MDDRLRYQVGDVIRPSTESSFRMWRLRDRRIDQPRVKWELSEKDRVMLKAFRIAANG